MPDVKIGVSQHSLNASKGAAFAGTEAIYAPNTVLTEPGVAGMTMVAWVTLDTASKTVMSISNQSADRIGHFLRVDGPNVAAFSRESAAFINSVAAHGKSAGDLCHVAGVWLGDSSRIAYADGVSGVENTVFQSPLGADRLCVGALRKSIFPFYDYPYSGDVYHAAWYNRALSPSEIAELAAGADPQDYSGLVRYLPCNGAANAANELIEPSTWTVTGTLADGAGDTTVTKQTFTNANLGGKTPKAAFVFTTNATVANTIAPDAMLSTGFTDGVSNRQVGLFSEDNKAAPANAAHMLSAANMIATLDASTISSAAAFDSFSADSTAVNFSNAAPDAYLASLVQFAGDDVKAEAGTVSVATTQDASVTVSLTDNSLEPDLILFLLSTGATDTRSTYGPASVGFASNESGGIGNYCVERNDASLSPTSLSAVVRNNRCAGVILHSGGVLKQYEVTRIAAGEFDLTTRDSADANARDVYFLALSFGGAKVKAGTIETPTDAGVDWEVTGVGFKPQFVLNVFTGLSGPYNVVNTTGAANGMAISAFVDGFVAGASIESADERTTTTQTSSRSGPSMYNGNALGSTLLELSNPQMTADGWTVAAADIATANATARQGIYVAVEDVSATIAPITGSASVAFGSSAYAAAINQIAGSAAFSFPTSAQAAAIHQLAASGAISFSALATLSTVGGPYDTTLNLHKGLIAALNAGSPSFADQVGQRITPAFLPQDSQLPALVYTLQTITRLADMSDMVSDGRVTFAFEVYGSTHTEAVQISDALDAVIRELRLLEDVKVQEVERLSLVDLSEAQGDVMVWRISSDYGIYIQDL